MFKIGCKEDIQRLKPDSSRYTKFKSIKQILVYPLVNFTGWWLYNAMSSVQTLLPSLNQIDNDFATQQSYEIIDVLEFKVYRFDCNQQKSKHIVSYKMLFNLAWFMNSCPKYWNFCPTFEIICSHKVRFQYVTCTKTYSLPHPLTESYKSKHNQSHTLRLVVKSWDHPWPSSNHPTNNFPFSPPELC